MLHAPKFEFPKSPDFGGNSKIGRCDRRKKKAKKDQKKKVKIYYFTIEMGENGINVFRG